MEFETILYDKAAGIARITLNRPARLNALCEQMFEEFHVALDHAEQGDDLRVLVITGAGRGFCAGADLTMNIGSDGTGGPMDLGAALERSYNPLIMRLRALPVPVISSINGVAAGAGASLALAADICIAARSAKFVLAFARIGLVPDAGLTYFLPQRIGMARALGLSLLGEEVGASDAQQWGLIWRCVDDLQLSDETDALARRLSGAATHALGLTKHAIYASQTQTLEQQVNMERHLQARAGQSRDFREGVAAFLAKRIAQFEGR